MDSAVPTRYSSLICRVCESGPVKGDSHGSGFAVALDLYKRACRPGAHVWSVWYRCSQFERLRNFHELTGTNLPWLHDGKPDEAVFKALAVVPMTKMPPGGREGLPFDVEELIRLIRKESEP